MTTASESLQRVCALEAPVLRRDLLCREHVEIEWTVSAFPASRPGQFLQLLCHAPADAAPTLLNWPEQGFPVLLRAEEWHGRDAFLRRPFSIADRWDDSDGSTHLKIISRAVGPGTSWLESLQPGQALNITGPLGHGFEIPSDERPIVLIGGGVGIPPLLYAARSLYERGAHDVTAIWAVRSGNLLPVRLWRAPDTDAVPVACCMLPGGASYQAIVTTDDGSLGLRGRTTDGLDAWHRQRGTPASGALVLACGPEAMLRGVAQHTRRLGLDCQLCIERTMGCGLGTCLSCVVRVRAASRPAGWRWALSCSEGPVFDRDALVDQGA